MIFGSCPPRPSADRAQVSSTTSWARRNRDHHGPVRDGATLRPIGAYRAFSSTAATTAAASVPPAPRIEAAANCAEPANVVADITIGAIASHRRASEDPEGDPEAEHRDRERRDLPGTVGEAE